MLLHIRRSTAINFLYIFFIKTILYIFSYGLYIALIYLRGWILLFFLLFWQTLCMFLVPAHCGYAAPHNVGHYALMTVFWHSVCLSVPYLTLSREREGVASWKLQEGSSWHGWPETPFRDQKVKGQGFWADRCWDGKKYVPYLQPTNFKLGTRMKYTASPTSVLTSKVKGQGHHTD